MGNNIEQTIKELEKAKINPADVQDMMTSALNSSMALMKRRIFNVNEDVEGKNFGKYVSKSYKKRRKAKGRQVAKKDLEMTGQLRKSIQLEKAPEGARVVSLSPKIDWQEVQVGRLRGTGRAIIFTFNEIEKEQVEIQFKRLMYERIDTIFPSE